MRIKKLTIITTKLGDNGTTNLIDRTVKKTDSIISCIGQIDYANAQIGTQTFIYKYIVREFKPILNEIQNNLFDLAADLICGTSKIGGTHISKLKEACSDLKDSVNTEFEPLLESILAVKHAILSLDETNIKSREYLECLVVFLQKLSGFIYTEAPWSFCLSLIMKVLQYLDLTEFLCGKFLKDILRMLNQIRVDLSRFKSDLTRFTTFINAACVVRLENYTSKINKLLSPLSSFVIPTGPSAPMHSVRTTVRMCEISFLNYLNKLGTKSNAHVNSIEMKKYLNRLSDLIFVFCRKLNQEAEAPEDLWVRQA